MNEGKKCERRNKVFKICEMKWNAKKSEIWSKIHVGVTARNVSIIFAKDLMDLQIMLNI